MMTPMIDIIFNLLIFFMLTPTFQAQEGYLTTNLPESAKTSGETIDRLQIYLEVPDGDDEGIIILLTDDRSTISGFGELLTKLRDMKARGLGPEHPVLISPMLEVQHRWVVKAFDTAIWAGFSKIQFTIPR